MTNRFGLDRFKKATAAEPFSVTQEVSSIQQQQQPPAPPYHHEQFQVQTFVSSRVSDDAATVVAPPVSNTAFGAGGSLWVPPDWAADPKSLTYWLDVLKEGDVVDKITLDRKRLIFGRQHVMCDLVLDHPSVSRQHAAVVLHKNGGVYVIDLGSIHGTFVANERLTKDNPVELETGQSLRFAASTRMYILRKNTATPVVPVSPPTDIVLPPLPDASDEEAILAYNTSLNRFGIYSSNISLRKAASMPKRPSSCLEEMKGKEGKEATERPSKKPRKSRVSFRDDYGGLLAEVVGVSDGADVSTEPGPVGVREGSLVGKYESLVQVTVIPKGQEGVTRKAEIGPSEGVTHRFKQYLEKVKSPGRSGGLYGDMYGESLGGLVGGSWATVRNKVDSLSAVKESVLSSIEASHEKFLNGTVVSKSLVKDLAKDEVTKSKCDPNFNDDDLFGEDEDT